jgi:uncharacterized protein
MGSRFMNEGHIILFCRTPLLGGVKKRIAKRIGEQNALRIYRHLLNSTLKTLSGIPGPKSIFFYGEGGDYFEEFENRFRLQKQQGRDLGERMYQALRSSEKEGYQRNVLVGADIPDLTAEDLIHALAELENNDLVLGPALDGGYYLVGGKKSRREIFEDIPWGTSQVYFKTLEKARKLKMRVGIGNKKSDIDTHEDILLHPDLKKLISLEKEVVPQ